AKIRVHEEHPSVLRLSERASQVDGRGALPVAHAGTRDRHDAKVAGSLKLLDGVPERSVLLSLESSRSNQADEMIVYPVDRVGGKRWNATRLDGCGLGDGSLHRHRGLGRAPLLERAVSVRLLERLEELAHCPRKPLAACASPDNVAVERSMTCRSAFQWVIVSAAPLPSSATPAAGHPQRVNLRRQDEGQWGLVRGRRSLCSRYCTASSTILRSIRRIWSA